MLIASGESGPATWSADVAVGVHVWFLQGNGSGATALRARAQYLEVSWQRVQSDHVLHELIGGPSCADCVQGDDAGGVDFWLVDVSLVPDLLRVTHRFFPKSA